MQSNHLMREAVQRSSVSLQTVQAGAPTFTSTSIQQAWEGAWPDNIVPIIQRGD